MTSLIKQILRKSPYSIYTAIQKKNNRNHSGKIIKAYLQKFQARKLHIGCGGNVMESWLNTDLVPYTNEIAFLDAAEKFPISDSLFDYIYSEHTFEHLDFKGQLNYLNESYRILRPGGKIRLATPDFDFLIHLKAAELSNVEKKYLGWNMNTFLSSVKEELKKIDDPAVFVINNYFRDWGHQLIHNKRSLKHLLAHSGFVNIIIEEVSCSQHVELQNLEKHGNMVTEEFNMLETMVMEAVKPS